MLLEPAATLTAIILYRLFLGIVVLVVIMCEAATEGFDDGIIFMVKSKIFDVVIVTAF